MLDKILFAAATYMAAHNLDTPEVVFTNDTNILPPGAMGVTRCSLKDDVVSCGVFIHTCYEHPKVTYKQLKTIVLHELAHYVDVMSDRDPDGHRGQWVHIMKAWGQKPVAVVKWDNLPQSCRRAEQ